MAQIVFTLLAAATFACAQMGSPNPQELEKAFEKFSRGQARLTCTASCSFLHGTRKNLYRSYYDGGAWKRLALEVIRVGLSNDLNYYYLGRSAEGLGLPEAAHAYYEIASRPAVDPAFGGGDSSFSPALACNSYGMNQCNGIVLPQAALAGIERTKRGTSAAKALIGPIPYENTAALQSERQRREEAETEVAALRAKASRDKARIDADKARPRISIASSVTRGKQGIVRGTVSDNVGVAELVIDGTPVAFDAKGQFEYSTFVPGGGISLEVVATDFAGLSSSNTIFLERDAQRASTMLSFDRLIPLGRRVKKNPRAIALIVGVGNYENTAAPAVYADDDATAFSDFASERLGIPEDRIKLLLNEGAGEKEILLATKRWLVRAIDPGKTDVYIFFAGHGLASDDGKSIYLLPYDGAPELLEHTAILRDQLFADIHGAKPRSVTAFLDTCYSGTTRGAQTLLASRPIVIRVAEKTVPEGFTVFTAAAGDETAKPLKEAQHGMFSYFLMKGMEGGADRNGDDAITAGELHQFVYENVRRQSAGTQTPELTGDEQRVLVEFR